MNSADRRRRVQAMHAIIDEETPWATLGWIVGTTLSAPGLAAPEFDGFRHGSAKYMALR